MKNEMNRHELDCFMDEVMRIVENSDDRTELIEEMTTLVEETAYDRGAYDETEIISELNNLMEDSDEYGFTELKNAIRKICEENSWDEENSTEEEEENEDEDICTECCGCCGNCNNEPSVAQGFVDDSTVDGKARVAIIKLLLTNSENLISNTDLEVGNAIAGHIAIILNSLTD